MNVNRSSLLVCSQVLQAQILFCMVRWGRAKSLILRGVPSAFEFDAYFEYLMNRFSIPEEILSPVSIKALKPSIICHVQMWHF